MICSRHNVSSASSPRSAVSYELPFFALSSCLYKFRRRQSSSELVIWLAVLTSDTDDIEDDLEGTFDDLLAELRAAGMAWVDGS